VTRVQGNQNADKNITIVNWQNSSPKNNAILLNQKEL